MLDFDELAAAAGSDPAAEDQLCSALLIHLRVWCRRAWFGRQTGADGDDVIQNTLAVVHRRLDRFESQGPGSFLRWVHGIASLEAKEAIRKRGRVERIVDAVAGEARSPATNLSSRIEQAQQLALVRIGVTTLVPAQQRAIESDLEDIDTRILAEQEGISIEAARALRCRARRKLKHTVVELAQPRPRFASTAVNESASSTTT